MSTTLEIIPLEGIDLEGTIPCQILWNLAPCTFPSAYRIISTCPRCTHRAVMFACTRCHDWGVSTGFNCAHCWSIRGIDRYL